MKILFTTENGPTKQIYFPKPTLERLESLGEVTYNPSTEPLTESGLARLVRDKDVCITHWSCPLFTEAVLAQSDRLRLIAHAAGSVADLVTEAVYRRGIKVCSANTIMGKYVAEGVLAYMLAALRLIPQQAYDLKYRKIWKKRVVESRSLFGARIGLVGLGTIGRFLLDLLAPFGVQIKLYDPYIQPVTLQECEFVEMASLEETLAWGEIVSLHASLTAETHGLLNENNLKLIRDGALLVNTARAAIIDEAALLAELRKGRFQAILDVYETEPLPIDHPLRELDNVILMPHAAGLAARDQMTRAVIDEIERFSLGEPLQNEIPMERFRMMTKEH